MTIHRVERGRPATVDYTEQEMYALLYGADVKVSWGEFGSKYEGLVERFHHP